MAYRITPENAPDGTMFMLAQDVENPKPDRRRRYDWRVEPVIEKGTRFRLEVRSMSIGGVDFEIRRLSTGRYNHDIPIGKVPKRVHEMYEMYGDDLPREYALAAVLTPHLEPVETTTAERLARDHVSERRVLAALIDRGAVTYEQVETINDEEES